MAKARIHHERRTLLPHIVAIHFFRELKARGKKVSVLISGAGCMTPILDAIVRLAKESKENAALLRLPYFFELDSAAPGDDSDATGSTCLEWHLYGPAREAGLIDAAQLHPLSYSAGRPTDLARYSEALRQISEFPDLALVASLGGGIEPNPPIPPHIAAIFPGQDWLWDITEPYVEVEGCSIGRERRVTITPSFLRRTGTVLAVMRGECSESAWHEYRDPAKSERAVPLKVIDGSAENTLFVDVLCGR